MKDPRVRCLSFNFGVIVLCKSYLKTLPCTFQKIFSNVFIIFVVAYLGHCCYSPSDSYDVF